MWGITCGKSSSSNWAQFIQKFIDLAPWAAANDIIFGVNEEMYHNDDAIISDQTILADLHAAAWTAKNNNPAVKLAISLAGDGELDKFINWSGSGNAGRGAFDYVCVNQYGTFTEFKASVDKLTAAYGSATHVTEFSTGRGFDPLYGNEASWRADIQARADYAQSSMLDAFFFYTYYHNSEMTAGTPPVVKWDIRTNTNSAIPATHHEAFEIFRRT